MSTLFAKVYNRFLEKITDDMYMELTPEDTIKDLQNLLKESISGFEFPRVNLRDYSINLQEIKEDQLISDDFIIGTIWEEIPEIPDEDNEKIPIVIVDRSYFNSDLSDEEINILAILMKQAWVQRQVTSIENTRMKYSGSAFKFTSQANHLAKLITLLDESRRDSTHMQRLYGRRIMTEDGRYKSTWSSLRSSVYGSN